MDQKELSQTNKAIWTENVYEMWCRALGTPEELAQKLPGNPKINHFGHLMGDVKGLRIVNLLGSNCRKAVPLARLGAEVTVVDISQENERYGLEYAKAAGVEINFIVADVFDWHFDLGSFDWVLMEGGILHYFASLDSIFDLVVKLLCPDGQLLLSDYHPLRNIISETDGELVMSGNYFDGSYIEAQFPAAAQVCTKDELNTLPKSKIKPWRLDQILNSVIKAGLSIQTFEEYSWEEGAKIPKVFNLLARKTPRFD